MRRRSKTGKQEIEDAMVAKLAEIAPGAEIVATAIVKDRAEAQTSVGQLLQANPDTNAVMTTNVDSRLCRRCGHQRTLRRA